MAYDRGQKIMDGLGCRDFELSNILHRDCLTVYQVLTGISALVKLQINSVMCAFNLLPSLESN